MTKLNPTSSHRLRTKRSLSQLGGQITCHGDKDAANVLRQAWILAEQKSAERFTHMFHTYPAKMHWAIPQHLLQTIHKDSLHVADPFCGSGTTGLEAMAAHKSFSGSDLNPLAIRIAKTKCTLLTPKQTRQLRKQAAWVGASTEKLLRSGSPINHSYLPSVLRSNYAPHLLQELVILKGNIDATKSPLLLEILTMVFSAMIVKFSRLRSETSEQRVNKKFPKYSISRFFIAKANELCEGYDELYRASDKGGTNLNWYLSDVRSAAQYIEKCDCIITSPPYEGTYNYSLHHRLRFDWLRMDSSSFHKLEIGARRQQHKQQWATQLQETLRSITNTLKVGGTCTMVIGDGPEHSPNADALGAIQLAIQSQSLNFVAAASQRRARATHNRNRSEHLILLERCT